MLTEINVMLSDIYRPQKNKMTNLIKKINTGIAVVLSAAAIAGTFKMLNLWAREDYQFRFPDHSIYVSQENLGINEVKYSKNETCRPQEFTIRTNFPWDNFISRTYIDKEGEGIVDSVFEFGPFSSINYLVRDLDYKTHKRKFDQADKQLMDLAKRYPK